MDKIDVDTELNLSETEIVISNDTDLNLTEILQKYQELSLKVDKVLENIKNKRKR